MPDDIKPNNADQNAEIARKQAAQDISGQSMVPNASDDTSNALDALLKEKQNPEPKPDAEPKPDVEPKPDAEPKPDNADPAPDDVAPKPDAEPKPDATPAATPPPDPHAKRAEEIFKDSPGLPAGASPKSSEAFAAVKIRAAQEISKLEQKNVEFEKKINELSEKLKNPVPAEVTQELEELRNFRARLDIDLDPKFKEYDKAVTSAQEFIYAQLKKSPAVTAETIEQIKKYGGPENVNMTKIFEVIKDPTIQRLVESKIADIEEKKFSKEEALKAAKSNVSEYLAERDKSFKQGAATHTTATRKEFEKLRPGLAWMAEQTVPAGADEAAQKSIKEHNDFVATTRKQLEEALQDDSPEMRAIMLTGMAQLFHTQRVLAQTKTEADTLRTQLAERDKLIARLKAPNRVRVDTSAPATKTDTTKPKDDFSTPAGDALDSIRKQVLETRAKAAAGT